MAFESPFMKACRRTLTGFAWVTGMTILLTALAAQAAVSQVQVSTGYDDEPRNSVPFSVGSGQPVPWFGYPYTTFYGNTNAAASYDPDESAILLQNLGNTTVLLSAASAGSYDLFAYDSITNTSIPLYPGQSVILAGPDGSEEFSSSALVSIGLTINGISYMYQDVATSNAPDGVLYGATPFIGGCESIPWTSIYSAPTNGVPRIPILGVVSPPQGTNSGNLQLSGPIGSDYEIDESTNLASATNWRAILYFGSTNSPFYFSAPANSNYSQIFFRAKIAN